MDLQSPAESIKAVLRYFQDEDPGAAARALERYACLTPHASRFEAYGRAIAFGGGVSCAPAPGGNTTF
jgi:erythromycin esterase-like protein